VGQAIPEGEVPGEIKQVNEFLNTLNLQSWGENARISEIDRDDFRTPGGLRDWLVARRLLDEGETVGASDLELAVTLRGALREAAWVNGDGPAGGAADIADRAFGEVPLVLELGHDLRPGLASGRGGVPGALGRILADVAVATARGTWARLKICRAEDCLWAYYDHSKSRTSRWCSMQTCGNRHKTRRYRQRQKAAGG
jgi:hypothetical protein